jgi:catechol 2,3-dioxygenase-like lactoylglutathione lyase family enzyme
MEQIAKLLRDIENGKILRRQFIQGMALTTTAVFAAYAAPKAALAFAGSVVPKAPGGKGFKAIAYNHLSYDVADVARSRDFYLDLFEMKLAWDDGVQSKLAFGDPSAPDSLYIRKVKRGQQPNVDHVAYSVADFDLDAAEAELKRRGLNPKADGPVAWIVKDPDGFPTQIGNTTGGFPGGAVKGAKREAGLTNLKKIPAPSGKGFKAIGAVVVLHVADVARSRDFYSDLLGMKVIYDKTEEPKSECFLRFGGNDGLCLRKTQRPDNRPSLDHFVIVIANYDQAAVETELKRRGLDPQPDSKWAWIIRDPDGMRVAVAGQKLLMGGETPGM